MGDTMFFAHTGSSFSYSATISMAIYAICHYFLLRLNDKSCRT